MPESVSTVDAILDGLRGKVTTVGYSQCAVCDRDRPPLETPEVSCGCDHTNARIVPVDAVPLADAVAAVHAAADARTRQIIAALREEVPGGGRLHRNLEAAAFVARRYAACGDGVVSNVAEWIARGIVREDAA